MTNTSLSECLGVIQGCHRVAALWYQTRPSLAVVSDLQFHPMVTGGGYSNRAAGLCLCRTCLAQPCLGVQHPKAPHGTSQHPAAPHGTP